MSQPVPTMTRKEALAAGLTRFFTGQPCKNGHICERFTSDNRCRECNSDRLKARYANNPEHWKAVAKQYTLDRTDEQRAKFAHRQREQRKIDPTRFREADKRKHQRISNDPLLLEKERARQNEKQKKRYRADPERFKTEAKRRHSVNRERARELAKRWKLANPEKTKALNLKWNVVHRMLRKKRVPSWLTEHDFAKMRELYTQAKATGMHVDHIIPLQGELVSGLHVPSNLQLLTPSENCAKRNRYEVK